MSDVTLLRKLTSKSILKFGKYHDIPVGMLIDLGHVNYLRWVYFNSSNISFFDDVLDKIKIPLEFRINKPGTLPENYEKLKDFVFNNLPENLQEKTLNTRKNIATKRTLGKYISNKIIDQSIFSKSNLTRLNHGHKT